jgi:hypothetical protein
MILARPSLLMLTALPEKSCPVISGTADPTTLSSSIAPYSGKGSPDTSTVPKAGAVSAVVEVVAGFVEVGAGFVEAAGGIVESAASGEDLLPRFHPMTSPMTIPAARVTAMAGNTQPGGGVGCDRPTTTPAAPEAASLRAGVSSEPCRLLSLTDPPDWR